MRRWSGAYAIKIGAPNPAQRCTDADYEIGRAGQTSGEQTGQKLTAVVDPSSSQARCASQPRASSSVASLWVVVTLSILSTT